MDTWLFRLGMDVWLFGPETHVARQLLARTKGTATQPSPVLKEVSALVRQEFLNQQDKAAAPYAAADAGPDDEVPGL